MSGYSGVIKDPITAIDWLQPAEVSAAEHCELSFAQQLEHAERELTKSNPLNDPCCLALAPEHEAIRWFISPGEVMAESAALASVSPA